MNTALPPIYLHINPLTKIGNHKPHNVTLGYNPQNLIVLRKFEHFLTQMGLQTGSKSGWLLPASLKK